VEEQQPAGRRDAPWDSRLNTGVPHVARVYDYWLVAPGLVRVSDWRPDSPEEAATPTILWGGVARKP
jgi:hypothetical protein